MELYLLRHGLAAERSPAGDKSDFDRKLTAKGRRQIQSSCATYRKWGLSFDLILSSPLVRAEETAAIAAKELKLAKRLRISNHLKPGAKAKDLIAELSQLRPATKRILLVGHEPDLSRLISLLVTGGSDGGFALKKGGMAKLEVDKLRSGRCAALVWLLTPKLLRQI